MSYIGSTPANKIVTASDMEDGVVSTDKLAANAVVTSKITDGTIATADVANNAITLAKMAAGTDGNIISYDASGDPVAIATGSDGQVLTSTGAGSPPAFEALPAAGGAFESALLHVRDERSNNTHGGSSTTSFQARVLNTVKTNEITGASLGSNQITLPAGTFYIEAAVPQIKGNSSGVQLYNTTDSAAVIIGTNNYNSSADYFVTVPILVKGRFTISGAKVFEIQHKVGTADSGKGFGFASNVGLINIYTEVLIWKV